MAFRGVNSKRLVAYWQVDLEMHDLSEKGHNAQFLHQQQQFHGVGRLERQLCRSGARLVRPPNRRRRNSGGTVATVSLFLFGNNCPIFD